MYVFPESPGIYIATVLLAVDNIDDIEPSSMLWARRFVQRVILLLVIMAFIVILFHHS